MKGTKASVVDLECMTTAQLKEQCIEQGIEVGSRTTRATMLQRLEFKCSNGPGEMLHPPEARGGGSSSKAKPASASVAVLAPTGGKKRALSSSTIERASKRGRVVAAASANEGDEWPQAVPILQRNTFHGQLRLMAGARPPRRWKSALLLTEQHFQKFLGAINSSSYSKTSGKGGAPLAVPVKQATPTWGKQAVLVVVSQSPFVTHSLSIERRAAGQYMASAGLKEKRKLAAPSGLGSFDACLFDLAEQSAEQSVTMELQGKGEYLSTAGKPLPNGPEWA